MAANHFQSNHFAAQHTASKHFRKSFVERVIEKAKGGSAGLSKYIEDRRRQLLIEEDDITVLSLAVKFLLSR